MYILDHGSKWDLTRPKAGGLANLQNYFWDFAFQKQAESACLIGVITKLYFGTLGIVPKPKYKLNLYLDFILRHFLFSNILDLGHF